MKIRGLLLCIVLLAASVAVRASRVDDAWQALKENRQEDALSAFESAVKEDPNNTRAYLGLMYYHNMNNNSSGAWQAFEQVLRIEKNYYPYAYAEGVAAMIYNTPGKTDEIFEKLHNRVLSDPEAPGMLQGLAAEHIGMRLQNDGKISEAKEMFARVGSIDTWNLIGPFENISASGYNAVYAPEKEFNPSATYTGTSGVPVRWFPITASRYDRWTDLTLYFYYSHAVYYANSFVYSPEERTADLRVGTSGFFKVFLNDDVVMETEDEFNNDIDTYVATVKLQKGWNRVLIKCGYSEIDRCNFLVRFTDAAGHPLSGLKTSAEQQAYKSHPGTPITLKNVFAEDFFRDQIKQHPDRMENYLLLADCYLRNDKGVEAERTLNEALKSAPDAIILLDHMLEAYIRGRKYDEITTTLEKIASLKVDVPSALQYKIGEQMSNEEYEQAEELINRLERFIPGSERIYALRIGLYSSKQQVEKILETSEEAFKKYPDNFQFMKMAALIAAQVHNDKDKSLQILKDYLDRNYTDDAIYAVADEYLDRGKFEKWEEMYQKLFELKPASPGYYYRMATTYFSKQLYDKAEQSLKKALEICPANASYYAKLGEIYRIRNEVEKAKEAYRMTLTYNPTDYDSRAVLREIEGKKSIFTQFSSISVDSLVRTAPSSEDYPNDPAIILLDDVKRVVYDGGSSETLQEMLVKVFNKQGIDNFKEYSLGYNSHAEALNIEKAVVIKKDGSEIKADISGGQIVFKSLEEGEAIYIKWRKKNYYTGKLHNHFWDTYYFNYYYPVANVRYALLVPTDYKFRYKARNMPTEPKISETEDGKMHFWALSNEPAIEYESGMPSLDEIGKVLTISSIEDWTFMVDWYRDLAQTKTRSTYEIEEKMKEILANKGSMSEDDILREVYEFITEYIRYSSVSFRQSGWIPQKARDVYVTKIGDCKDVATLCISMLREAGIPANYVLVKTSMSSRAAADLPMPDFDHCIVSVDTKKGPKILDLTANNFPIGSVPEMDIDGFALLIKPGVTAPTRLTQSNFTPRAIHVNTVMTVEESGHVNFDQKTVFSGSMSAYLRDFFRHKGKNEQEKAIIESLGSDYPNVKLGQFSFSNLDTITPTLGFNVSFDVPEFVNDMGRFKILKSGWAYGKSSDEALAYEERTYPYEYYPGTDTVRETLEIRLPQGYVPVDLKDANLSSSIADYSAKYSFKNGVITATRSFINKKNMVTTEEFAAFKSFYNSVVKEDTKQLLIEKQPEKEQKGKRGK